MLLRSILLSVCLFSITTSAICQNESLGRLPDGRAYRVDEEGNQLVDHIAELELQKKESEFRLGALETDLEAKEKELARLRRLVKPASPSFYGEDTSSESDCSKYATELRVTKAAFESSKQQREELRERLANLEGEQNDQSSSNKACSARLRKVKASSANLENTLAQCQEGIKECSEAKSRMQNAVTSLKAALNESEQMLVKTRSMSKQYKSDIKSAKANLAEQFSAQKENLQERIESRDAIIKSLKARLKRNENLLNEARISRISMQKRLSEAEVKVEELMKQEQRQVIRARYQPPARRDATKSQAFVSIKSQASKYIRDIARGRVMRDQLYARYNAKEYKPVSISLSPLKTSSGVTYSSLRAAVQKAKSLQSMQNYLGQLKSIHTKLQDDIGLLRRLSR